MNLSTLLNRSEGDTLDFKRENYRFRNRTDEEKSELIKDIIALANAWKATDAHIIIGVEESNGRAVDVPGVTPELSDSDSQQLVNSKTNRPVAFAIEHVQHEGKQLSVIRISQKQARPIFLNKNYGRLKKNVVYIRHGSSTDEASPDEIVEMAKQDIAIKIPEVELRFQITVDAFCFRSEFPMAGRRDAPTYSDGFELFVRNNGNAMAQHIEGSIELPRGILINYVEEVELENRDPLIAIAQSERITLEFSNYLREASHSHLAKPNPLQWKPLLPGRELELLSLEALPLRRRLNDVDASIKWQLAVDNCSLQIGETRFSNVTIVQGEVN